MATPETNAYETTARNEGRAGSDAGPVPRCTPERAVERPAPDEGKPSRRGPDETRDERDCGWHRGREERALMKRRPPMSVAPTYGALGWHRVRRWEGRQDESWGGTRGNRP